MAWAEGFQDNLHNGWVGPNVGLRRTHPAEPPFTEWDPFIRRWREGAHCPSNFRSNKYFTRPHDGKRPGSWGRFKDVLSGEGADVFVTISGDKRTLLRDRPQHRQWAGWPETQEEWEDRVLFDKDHRDQDEMGIWRLNHTKAARMRKPMYDYNRRKFLSHGQARRDWRHVMQKAQWPQGARRDDALPWTHRDYLGWDHSLVPRDARFFAGGRPVV